MPFEIKQFDNLIGMDVLLFWSLSMIPKRAKLTWPIMASISMMRDDFGLMGKDWWFLPAPSRNRARLSLQSLTEHCGLPFTPCGANRSASYR